MDPSYCLFPTPYSLSKASSMRRLLAVIIVLAVAGAAGYFAANRLGAAAPPGQYQGDGRVQISRPTVEGNDVRLKPETAQISTTGDPVENTLKALFKTAEDGSSAIPKGTRLNSVKVEGGVARVDVSKEFSALNDGGGNTSVSLTQNAICRALAQFPSIQKVTVLVDGKVFEDAHSGAWEDLPVADPAPEGAR
jgi:hypothetical protein